MKVSKRERTIIIIGIIFAFIISLKAVGSSVTLKGKDIKESIEVKGILLERYRKIAAEKDEAAAELSVLKIKLNDEEGRLLTGSTETLASVELQTIMEETAKKRGVRIKRVKTLKPKENGDYHKVFVEITFSSEISSLVDFLYDIEYNPKSLTISELNTRRHTRNIKEPLQTTLRVEGKLKRSLNDADVAGSKLIETKGLRTERSI